MKKVEKEEKTVGKRIAASNFVSESGHAAATYDLHVCGTIDLQYCAVRGQSESNNNFGRDIESLLHRRKAFKEKIKRGMGGFHLFFQSLRGQQYLLFSVIGSLIVMTSELLWFNSWR